MPTTKRSRNTKRKASFTPVKKAAKSSSLTDVETPANVEFELSNPDNILEKAHAGIPVTPQDILGPEGAPAPQSLGVDFSANVDQEEMARRWREKMGRAEPTQEVEPERPRDEPLDVKNADVKNTEKWAEAQQRFTGPVMEETIGVRPAITRGVLDKPNVTEEDCIKFMESIATGKVYRETFRKGPAMSVTFRTRTSLEMGYQRACLSEMIAANKFALAADFYDAVARFNLFFQLESFAGKAYSAPLVPPMPWTKANMTLEEQYWASPLGQMREEAITLLFGFLRQFEEKLSIIHDKILSPTANFSEPAARTSYPD